MKYKDRQEILTQLQDAFIPEEKRESRLTTEVIRIDNHNVARVTEIKDLSVEEQLYAKYPDAVVIKEMITAMSKSTDSSVKKAGSRLREIFTEAFEDPEKINKLVNLCREYETKYYSTADEIKKQLVLYCLASEI